MRIFFSTDVGLVRKSNQDSVGGGVFDDGTIWAVLCDGMGGSNGGEYASSKAVEVIGSHIKEKYRSGLDDTELCLLLQASIANANAAVYRQACCDERLTGMGTTVVAALVCGGVIYIAHAGDSRAYLINSGTIRQITKDHSMVQEMVDMGQITAEEAEHHPRKNIITRALGVYDTIEVDFNEVRLGEGDMILLCSDGLSNCVSAQKLAEAAQTTDPEQLPLAYIDMANAGGGSDNITALIICE